ncbi:MAG: hypothetical protein BGO26_14880 [Actinobacteria bacterium 69-20]|nr:hypothetical protein [Actinomycetota bacterium]OJV29584.1 MAG: hypothetical protein BGO26_14880 [Actinobacteria bacterium 69-20]
MFSGVRWHDMPGRIATGAYILNSGISKRHATPERAGGLHTMAASAFPLVKDMPAETFVRRLSTAEIVTGATLLNPLVPTAVAGAALAAFSGGLVTLYFRSPGTRLPGSIRPSDQGTALAKDTWMFGMALGFLMDSVGRRCGRRARCSR